MSTQVQNHLASLAAQHQAIANSKQLASTNTTSTQYPQPVLDIRRPWLDPPEGYSPFDYQAGIALPTTVAVSTTILTPATGAAGVLNNGLGLVVDTGYDGVINYLSCNFLGAGFQDFSGDIVWILFADSKPIRNFNNITSQKGTVQFPRQVSPIRIYSGQTITWVVIHAANVALNGPVVCTMTGYTYPNRG